MGSLANFEGTITYGQFFNDGGVFTPIAGGFLPIPFEPMLLKGLHKNCYSVDDGGFRIGVAQAGAYFVDLSFTADSGDDRAYTLKGYTSLNGGADTPLSGSRQIEFFQQVVEQKYEVSYNTIVELEKGEELAWYIKVGTLSAKTLQLLDIKLVIWSLQQLGQK